MKDKYIDLAEIPRYSSHFTAAAATVTNIEPTVVPLLISWEQAIGARVTTQLSTVGDTRATATTSRRTLGELRDEGILLLRRVYETLYPMRNDGVFELTRFFKTGRKADIGQSIADVLAALRYADGGFALYPEIPSTADLRKSLANLLAQAEEASAASSGDTTTKRTTSTGWNDLRKEWNVNYLASQEIMRGLYRRKGYSSGEWKALFLDFQASGSNTKADSSAAPETSEPEGSSGQPT